MDYEYDSDAEWEDEELGEDLDDEKLLKDEEEDGPEDEDASLDVRFSPLYSTTVCVSCSFSV